MITLEQIQEAQSRVNRMIDEFVAQDHAHDYRIPEACIELRPGERYAGIVLDDNGKPSHHLILLPGETKGVTHDAAVAWAAYNVGELPTRREQSLLFANLCGFKPAPYWSAELLYAGDSSYAWCQDFDGGDQDYERKSEELLAVAVRRVFV